MLRYAAILFMALSITPALATEVHVLDQPDAPVKISGYTASYKSPERGIGDGSIIHRMTVESTSGERVVAYGIGFQVFDSFKRSLGRPFVGYDMIGVAGDYKATPIWENRATSAYLFQGHGTGVAYVAIARMADGSIWKANESSIENQLTNLELDLAASEEGQ